MRAEARFADLPVERRAEVEAAVGGTRRLRLAELAATGEPAETRPAVDRPVENRPVENRSVEDRPGVCWQGGQSFAGRGAIG